MDCCSKSLPILVVAFVDGPLLSVELLCRFGRLRPAFMAEISGSVSYLECKAYDSVLYIPYTIFGPVRSDIMRPWPVTFPGMPDFLDVLLIVLIALMLFVC